MDYSSSLERLWELNKKTPDVLIAKIRRCFKGVLNEAFFERIAIKIQAHEHSAARELLLRELNANPNKNIVVKRLNLTVFLDENTNKSRVKKQDDVIVNANKLAAEKEWDSAESLLLTALKEEENTLYLEALKGIYQARQRYADESRIEKRLLDLQSYPLQTVQSLEEKHITDHMPSDHDLEYLIQVSESYAPLEEQHELDIMSAPEVEQLPVMESAYPVQDIELSFTEANSTVTSEPEPELELEPESKPESELELDLDLEFDEGGEADEDESLSMELFTALEDDYGDSYSVDEDVSLYDDQERGESKEPEAFEDELYFYQFDPDELLADNDDLDSDITSAARITREDRALQKAAEFVGKFDWPHSALPLVTRIFYLSGWGATRVALEREAKKGLTASELVLAAHLKAIWADNEMYWMAYDTSGSFNLSHKVLSWPTTLLIVRSFDLLPQLAELEVLVEELFESWYENDTLCRAFRAFARYLWFRFSDLKGTLPADLWFDFLPPSELPAEEYSDLGSYDLLEIEKYELLSDYGLLNSDF